MPIWWLGQIITPFLDKYNTHPEEWASYTAEKRKS